MVRPLKAAMDKEQLEDRIRAEGRTSAITGLRTTGRRRPAVRRKLAHQERLFLIGFKGTGPDDPTGRCIPSGGTKPVAPGINRPETTLLQRP